MTTNTVLAVADSCESPEPVSTQTTDLDSRLVILSAAVAAGVLSACGGGGGGGGGGGAVSTGLPSTSAAPDQGKQDAPLTVTQSARFLTQATFGPTQDSVTAMTGRRPSEWIAEQMAIPAAPDYVNEVQRFFDRGSDWLPQANTNFSPVWVRHKFWATAVTAPDQLRRRVVHSLMQIYVLSTVDSPLWEDVRPVAQFIDNLGRNAFGNFRTLLQDVALNPAMGMYLSHFQNQKANPAKGTVPDENFAREVMQLFSIGLNQLNIDGSVKTDASGRPLETYNNDDVIGLARVFTGLMWDRPDGNFFRPNLTYDTKGNDRFDLKPMRVFPEFHEPGVKSFLGVTIAAGTDGNRSIQIALDTLFNHPNVGPFIGKQLIQRLVTSNPSPAYVRRVAEAFNNNGTGVRGDMAAVVRAILLDTEARMPPAAEAGKLREPVLRNTQMMRALSATSATGRWMTDWEHRLVLQRPIGSSSVFNFYRPGYVPPNTRLADANLVAPEFQIANESTVIHWINHVSNFLQWGVGWISTSDFSDIPPELSGKNEIQVDFMKVDSPYTRAGAASDEAAVDLLDLLLFAGTMSPALRAGILDAMKSQVTWNDKPQPWAPIPTRARDRLQIAAMLALSSSEYMIER